MELFFNECSVLPLSDEVSDARNRIFIFLRTAQALKKYNFNIIRAHDNFFAENLGANYSPSSFLNDTEVSRTLKILLQSIVRNPFIPDVDSFEAEAFVLNRFETEDENAAIITPEGLAAAYIHESHTISFSGSAYWEKEILPVIMINTEDQTFRKDILNHAFERCTVSPAFVYWLQLNRASVPINSLANIQVIFPPTQFDFEPQAVQDFISWFYDDIRFQIRIKDLINDIAKNPFIGGLGHTETLAGTGGRASKRIAGKDRLVYTYTPTKIVIHRCRGHYNDH